MTSTSRLGLALLATVGPLVAGCFGPQIQSGAFACEPSDDPPCPTGFTCVNLRCVVATADVLASAPHDLGDDPVGSDDLAAGGSDLAHGAQDQAVPPDLTTPRDLTPPPDLATGVCGHAGTPCTTIQECCSNYCRSDGICIGG
jgi:hypothetical protein